MRKWLLASMLALASIGASANRASAWWYPDHHGVYPASVAFPMITPSGYFTNSYYFAWYYPWYANYNYSHGSYANWWMGGGYASYPGQQMWAATPPGQWGQPWPVLPPPRKDYPKKDHLKKEPGKVAIALPADAKLLFNGALAGGSGESRTFVTPDLNPELDYEYVLTAEVVREGQVLTATERVIVRAGETTSVTFTPTATVRK